MTPVECITPKSKIKFKSSMLNSSLSDYSDAYIFVSGTITTPNTETASVPNNKKIVKNLGKFTTIL